MQISVLLDRSRPESLTAQMVDQIRAAIRCARFAPGTRLPSFLKYSFSKGVQIPVAVHHWQEGAANARPGRVNV